MCIRDSSYYPIAHMVWWWPGPDAIATHPKDPVQAGLLWGWGALDFAGGTVVHINAGVAALMGCLILGPRKGFRQEPMQPHSLTLTLVLSLIHISEPTRLLSISYAVFCLKKK